MVSWTTDSYEMEHHEREFCELARLELGYVALWPMPTNHDSLISMDQRD